MARTLFKNSFLSVIFCILFSCILCTDDDVCTEETSCLCKLNEERYIDISHVVTADQPYLIAQSKDLTYYFYPCQDFKFNHTALNLTIKNTTTDECSVGTSICLYNATNQTLTNLGTTKDAKFSNSKLLIYTKTDKPVITTTFKLDCTPNDALSFLSLDPSKGPTEESHQLILFSPHACVHSGIQQLSTGSVLVILFFTVFGIYLLGGALVLHFLRGARGKEMIPNLDFWLDLPYLVKDGIVYLLNGCSPTSINTVETYDRI